MKKCLPYILILVLGFLYLRQCSQVRDLKSEIQDLELRPDTVYKNQGIKIPEPYPVPSPPEKVIVYLSDTVKATYKEIKFVDNFIGLYTPGYSDSILVNKWFLLLYPQNNKLISFDLTSSKLDIDLLTTQGLTVRNQYKLDLERYNYRMVNNSMTAKKKFLFQVKPELEYTFRPFNNLHDLNLGLNFKTRRFIYELGVNANYYPGLNQNKIKYDMLVGIKYRF